MSANCGTQVHYLNTLDSLNTSNQRIRNYMQGKGKDEPIPTGVYLWVDVRDVALAHVKAMELPKAANKRFFVTAGHFSHREIVEAISKNFPDLRKELPSEFKKGVDDYPEGEFYGYDNSRSKEILGLKFRTLEECVVDTVKSLQAVGA